MELIVGWLIFAFVAAWIASSKGRSGFGIFILSVLLSPLVGIIVALAMQRGEQVQASAVVHGGVSREYLKCPFCAEAVRFEALKCKHCGSDLSTSEIAATRRKEAIDAAERVKRANFVLVAVFVLFVLYYLNS